MNVDDALQFIVDCLRDPNRSQYSNYGYEIYLLKVIQNYLQHTQGVTTQYDMGDPNVREASPYFYAAAWELCRRGVLRPSVRRIGDQADEHGSGGAGYSVTPLGERWLEEAAPSFVIPADPSRVAELFGRFRERLGDGFYQRSQEAVACYSGNAYLACCAMSGAAAESIILSIAIAKTNDESGVLAKYRTASGRTRVQNIILGQAPEHIRRPFNSFSDLLNYWRDEAAHGTASDISEFEAHEALSRLLRFAHFADDRWDDLTARPV